MAKFSNMLLVSDIDGTLLGGAVLPEYNIEKINYFIENGGLFTVATGRCADALRDILKKVRFSAPAALANGVIIYDYDTESVIASTGLDDNTRKIVFEAVKEGNPYLGVELYSRADVIDVSVTREIQLHTRYEKLNPLYMSIDEALSYEWNKVLLTFEEGYTPAQMHEKLIKMGIKAEQLMFTNAYLDDGIHDYLEVIPLGADKGTGIKMLAKTLGVDIKNVYGIGDYYNDIPMLKAVGCAAVVDGAPEDIAKLADFVSSPVEKGAVGHFIDYIEERMQNNEN